jgi:hypothetical protein
LIEPEVYNMWRCKQALEAVLDAEDLPAILNLRGLHDGSNDGI